MANCRSIAPICSGGDQQVFSLQKTVAHITRKANFKQIGPAHVARRTVMNRLRILIDGNTAADRYRRNAYEGSQRVTAAIAAEKHRAKASNSGAPVKLDLANNKNIKSRFWRQDNIRFNRALRTENENGTLSRHGKWAMRLSRWAHHANGITELGAAPTGMTQKSIKILSNPKFDDKTERGHWRTAASLVPVFCAVTAIGKGLSESLGRIGNAARETLKKDVTLIVGGVSAIAALASLFSLGFGGCSAATATKAPLEKGLVDNIEKNHNKHMERLYLLLNEVKSKPNAQTLLMKAMKRGVGKDYRCSDKTPILLHRLMNAVKSADSRAEARQAIEDTVGSYLTEVDPSGFTPEKFLDPENQKGELLRRENHFIALTNLIEHTAIDDNKDVIFRDTRQSIERGFEKLQHSGSKKLWPGFLKRCGANQWAERSMIKSSPEYQAIKDAQRKNPLFAHKYYRSAQNILDNPHQYGQVTVGLTRCAEFLRVVNHSILLSLNYQLTRPIAWLSGRITESAFKIPNSRSMSFSIGRFFSSATWAVAEALLIVSLAGGNGVGFNGPEANTSVNFPLQIELSSKFAVPVSVVSTAAQMLVVAVPALIFMGAAKIALEIEGWKGNVERSTENLHKRRQVMDAWT